MKLLWQLGGNRFLKRDLTIIASVHGQLEACRVSYFGAKVGGLCNGAAISWPRH